MAAAPQAVDAVSISSDSDNADVNDASSITSSLVDPKDAVLGALDEIQSAASFAGEAAFKGPVRDLGLSVNIHGVGPVTFPLQEEAAQRIIGKARLAPHGRGEETIIDTAVRNTWELDASQFTLVETEAAVRGHKGWRAFLQSARDVVARDMGINEQAYTIRAEPYKMLLYEKGAHFKTHTDSPKIPGMFGTLVLVLPSIHEGGDLILKHRGKQKTFRSSLPSLRDILAVMCWYSDVQHEVTPVTSGYRWVLTPAPKAAVPSATRMLDRSPAALRAALQNWLGQNQTGRQPQNTGNGSTAGIERCLVYGMDHHYTEAALKADAVKGRDKIVMETLQAAAAGLPVDIHLAILEKEEEGDCEIDYSNWPPNRRKRARYDEPDFHAMHEVNNTSFFIHKLVDLEGVHLASEAVLEEDHLLRDTCFDGAEGEERDYDDNWTGNAGGPTATHAYKTSGIVLVPHITRPEFLIYAAVMSRGSTNNFKSLVTYYTKKCLDLVESEGPRDEALVSILQALCTAPGDSCALDKDAAMSLLQTIVQLREWAFFEAIVQKSKNVLDVKTFFTWIAWTVEDDIDDEDDAESRDASTFSFSEVKTPLLAALKAVPALEDALATISIVSEPSMLDAQLQGEGPTAVSAREQWARTALDAILESLESRNLGYKDGMALFQHCMSYYGMPYIQTNLVPRLRNVSKRTAFSLGVLFAMARTIMAIPVPHKQEWLALYEPLARALVDDMDVPALESPDSVDLRIAEANEKAKRARESNYPVNKTDLPRLKIEALAALNNVWPAAFYKHLLGFQTPETLSIAEAMATKIATDVNKLKAGDEAIAKQARKDNLRFLWIPFLRVLVAVVKDDVRRGQPPTSTTTTPTTTTTTLSLHQRLFINIFDAYLDSNVGPSPDHADMTFARPRIPCICNECYHVNDFLSDGTKQVFRRQLTKPQRYHIHQRLDAHGIDCQHETERHTYPETLVITKTTTKSQKVVDAWNSNKRFAQDKIKEFPVQALKVLLGPEYERIVTMEKLYPPGKAPELPKPKPRGKAAAPAASTAAAARPADPAPPARATTPPTSLTLPDLKSPLPSRERKRRALTQSIDLTSLSDD